MGHAARVADKMRHAEIRELLRAEIKSEPPADR